jgi:hypothetical protein
MTTDVKAQATVKLVPNRHPDRADVFEQHCDLCGVWSEFDTRRGFARLETPFGFAGILCPTCESVVVDGILPDLFGGGEPVTVAEYLATRIAQCENLIGRLRLLAECQWHVDRSSLGSLSSLLSQEERK